MSLLSVDKTKWCYQLYLNANRSMYVPLLIVESDFYLLLRRVFPRTFKHGVGFVPPPLYVGGEVQGDKVLMGGPMRRT